MAGDSPQDLTAAYCQGFDDALRYAADLAEDQDLFDLAEQLRTEADAPWLEFPE